MTSAGDPRRWTRGLAVALLVALGVVGAGSCTSVLGLDPYQSAPSALCHKLDLCYAAGALPRCEEHVAAALADPSPDARRGWLMAFSDDACLGSCTSARRCLDLPPVCGSGSCAIREECCGFLGGQADCVGQACCAPRGAPCGRGLDCCSNAGTCDALTGACGGALCGQAMTVCQINEQCCSHSCVHGQCTATICNDDGFDCAADEDCCNGFCDASKHCGSPQCTPAGILCKDSKECCEGLTCFRSNGATVGVCSTGACLPSNVDCTTDTECCSGHCDPSFFKCGVACQPDHVACQHGADCCSGSCTGGTCQPVCSTGYCTQDADCCSAHCLPGGTCARQCIASPCNHDVCAVGAPLAESCHAATVNTACAAAVCAADDYCCCTTWDVLCVQRAVGGGNLAQPPECAGACK